MAADTRFISRTRYKIIAIAVAAVLIVSGISLYYWGPFSLNNNSERQLKLIAAEDSNSIQTGQNLTLSVGIYNDGPTSIFNVSNLWPNVGGQNNRPGISPCSFDVPYGFAIVAGYVTNESLASSKPLDLWQPGIYNCPLIFPVGSYRIVGFSSEAFILYSSNPPIPITLVSTIPIAGYWFQSSTPNGSYHFVYFPTGQYTVIIADEWGATELLHFQVS